MGLIRKAGAAAVLAAGLMSAQGCQGRKQTAPQARPQPSMEAAQQMRETLLRADPSARIGIVAAALPDVQLVSVREVPAEEFGQGDGVEFLDANGEPLGTGTVERVVEDAVHVRYAAGGARVPTVGDLAIRAVSATRSLPPGGEMTAPGGDMPASGGEPAPGVGATPDAGGDPAETTGDIEVTTPAPGGESPAVDTPQPRAGGASRLPPRRTAGQSRGAAGDAGAAQPDPADANKAPARPDAPDAAPADPTPADAAPGDAAPGDAAPADAAPADAKDAGADTSTDAPAENPSGAPADAPEEKSDEKPEGNK